MTMITEGKLTLTQSEYVVLKDIIEKRLEKIRETIQRNKDDLDEYERDIKNYTTYDLNHKLTHLK
jgi:Na+/phosphate symporter